MASVFAAPPSQLNLTSRRSSIHRAFLPSYIASIQFHSNASPFPSFRYRKNIIGLELRQRSIAASKSTDGNSIKEENSSSKASSDDAQGPPFLTILAGFFVLSLILWIFSSAVTSLLGLVVKLISAK
ncbi:uncharacterized protein LOC101220885 [Cucumis sativus]|uniref:Uncharacterized protein n=1 Tax=Cucumis sativus TaxID=3659 RepID=A0A0A0K9W1_CUCSA|nr:uncharacterized protein LOC101220885 [Cucumis sativus]KGN45172.1 hypothetical protein Csa_016505 [Cucumis sativus]